MQVAIEKDRAAGESSGESASEAAQEHVLTCNRQTQSLDPVKAPREL